MDAIQRLKLAVKARDRRRLKDVIARGADPNAAVDGDGRTILYWAAVWADALTLSTLLEAGARPAHEKSAATSLHVAAGRGDVAILQLLLKQGGKHLLGRVDADGCTPLMRAVAGGHLGAAELLLAAGADVNARGHSENTALRIAAADCGMEMVRMLVEAGADPRISGRMSLTPLDRAAERSTPEGRRVKTFLERWIAEHLESPRHASLRARRTPGRRI